jgi:hypothetical protein
MVLHHRSHITRSIRAGKAWLVAAALVLAAVVGCQNNSDRDLIARDRRMQEDQIYALQDYINQYQQLVCRYRSENCALKRQLSEGYAIEPQPSEAQPTPRDRQGGSTPKSSPQFQTPVTPGGKEQQPPAKTPKIETPDVPPLKTTTTDEGASSNEAQVGDVESQGDSSPRVLAASYNEPAQNSAPGDTAPGDQAPGEAASAAGPPAPIAANEQAAPAVLTPSESASNMMLSGEVVTNDSGGGPRLMIDVAPFAASGRVEWFDGSASLMLLATGDDGQQQSIGRWDFNPHDVRAAIDPSANEPTMRFFVELPAGTPIGASTQLWVRLVPRDGAKLLAHANVDLARPGLFSSRADKLWPTEEAVVAASYVDESKVPAVPAADVATTINEGNWAIAAPGRPANLPPEARDASGGGGWRVSTEPMPVVLASGTEVLAPPTVERPVPKARSKPEAVAAKPLHPPGWTPERAGESTRRVASRPSWSASR